MNYLDVFIKIQNRFFSTHEVLSKDLMIFPCGVSRSGTTLLSAILDAHSMIAMGYEMLFPDNIGVDEFIYHLNRVQSVVPDLKTAGSVLRKEGFSDLGKWLSRCHRLDLDFDELLNILQMHQKECGNSLVKLRSRIHLIKRVVDAAKLKSKKCIGGFKISASLVNNCSTLFPNSKFIYIIRDPRDVYASLKKQNFQITIDSACKRWIAELNAFIGCQKKHSKRCFLVRYEDLVCTSRESVARIFDFLELDLEEETILFQDSDARILDSSHPNAINLKKGFFNTSVGRYKIDLSQSEIEFINSFCGEMMNKFSYMDSSSELKHGNDLYPISRDVIIKKKKLFAAKKKFDVADYEDLVGRYVALDYRILTLLEFTRAKLDINDKILAIRHDVDHDHMTAMKMAKWEYDNRIKSTYCLLHSSWYYGHIERKRILHTRDLVDCATYIAGLGHEISLHNNLIVTALKYGIDPIKMLEDELAFFRSIGVDIKGTASHGDSLCRELNFRNYELFCETCDGRYGGPRSIWYGDSNTKNVVTLGEISMFDFGLEYEAYEIYWDVYHTDSGGSRQTKYNRRGMRQFGQTNGKIDSLVGVLAHPIWWNFDS